MTRRAGLAAVIVLCGLVSSGPSGCTRASTQLAIQSQRRADAIQQAVFEQQHEALCILLYRDLTHRLAAADGAPADVRHALLSDAWNARDQFEFWAQQHERARALRLVGVDAVLFGEQSMADLLLRGADRHLAGAEAVLSAIAGSRVFGDADKPPGAASPPRKVEGGILR